MIPQATQKALEDLLSQMPSGRRVAIDDAIKEILAHAIPLVRKRSTDRAAFFKSVESIILHQTRKTYPDFQNLFRRALIAKLALELPMVIDQMDLPENILELYPESFDRLSEHLGANEHDTYDISSDFFRKDLGFCLGLSIPCGAQVVDLTSYFLWRSVFRALTRFGNIKAALRFFRVGGTGPWFGIHTESRYLADFNEPGWDACYLRIADLLEGAPHIRGMMGSSWFYDPQLLSISPRLAYLQERPLERGAFMIRHGTAAIDIERATLTSKTRRSLYVEGKYVPVSHTLLWPRQDLISWARSKR